MMTITTKFLFLEVFILGVILCTMFTRHLLDNYVDLLCTVFIKLFVLRLKANTFICKHFKT